MSALFTNEEFLKDKFLQYSLTTNMDLINKWINFPSLGGSQFSTVSQVADFYKVDKKVISACYKKNKETFEFVGVIVMNGKEIIDSPYLTGKVIIEKVKGGLIINGVKVSYTKNILFTHNALLMFSFLLEDSIVANKVADAVANVDFLYDIIDDVEDTFKDAYKHGDMDMLHDAHNKKYKIKCDITSQLTA